MSSQNHRIGFASVIALIALLTIAFPLLLDPFRLNLIGKYLALAFVAIGIVLTWGYGGILSLGQGVFFGVGGYLMAMFLKLEASAPELPDFMVWSSVETLPIWWTPFRSLGWTVLGIFILPAVVAYLFSYAIFRRRVSGVYFAIVTLSLALTLTVVVVGQQGDTGGANGITDFRTVLGMDILSDESLRVLYFIEVAFLAVAMFLALALVRTRFGKILIAIRDREDRVRFSGYDTAHMKAFVFACGAVLASVGGAFFTLQVGLISPSVIGVVASVEMVIYAAVGGRLSIPGAVVGALLIGFLKSYLSETFPEAWLYFLGAVFILVVWVMPNGLAGLKDQWQSRRSSARSVG
ncbi:MAG: urea ABC transporter permease subunit UrtC [Thiobacillus sp.]|jgi:urea transport system permease protein|uniref:urea ABC transporter permease subunit UrtC n=1 Tax=Hydrogenophaga TaxID=47420 RepID=UPI001CF92FE7|nr:MULTISPECIES: urea ABC transporter permease subunit UrtC [Hydrogenophaga]MBW8468798.1 urea ABC transporter permease subunit UrtC [Thiobacillus sp.]MDP2021241.1 urea ABC transporter permease subunit UrtC [Hydrogenophaga sp.]MDZ4173927.1 urea ABC transporter permease subunit UrtC [Hydrogenophaga sp.]MDZ4291380.1 urea ABC transporter permease subunit UrtC [Hydrogenophaga sp.]UCU94986.1 urea ABC transporter permease subunit UrtC [Hydrogenophaga taeniospiralis]